MVIKFLIWLL